MDLEKGVLEVTMDTELVKVIFVVSSVLLCDNLRYGIQYMISTKYHCPVEGVVHAAPVSVSRRDIGQAYLNYSPCLSEA